MHHKLRVLVRLDIDRKSAVLAVNGCLTIESYRALLPVIRRASALIDGLAVVVDLTSALHLDAAAAQALNDSIILEFRHHDVGVVTLRFPDVYPECALLANVPPVRQLVVS